MSMRKPLQKAAEAWSEVLGFGARTDPWTGLNDKLDQSRPRVEADLETIRAYRKARWAHRTYVREDPASDVDAALLAA